jgi:hypothetical protein
MSDKQVQFYPFHAINDFMRDDFRLEVVRQTLQGLPDLPDEVRAPIERLTRKSVQIQGFRNPAKAPTAVRLRPTAESFAKSPQMCAAILAAWAEIHALLRQRMYDFLISRGWEVLPPEADRTKLPGFLIKWPDGEDFDTLNSAFRETNPEMEETEDNISLMAVWIAGRLPYQLSSTSNDEQPANQATGN